MHKRGIEVTLAAVIVIWAFTATAQEALHQVVAVPTAKMLELEGGAKVRLAAIQAPNRARGVSDEDDLLAPEAHETLQRMALNKQLRLQPVGEGKDRRGRVVAMAYNGEVWLQEEMLRAGMAWVYSFDDSREYAPKLLEAEHEAEAAKRGVWGKSDYAVLSTADAAEHVGEFRLVRGTIHEVADVRGRYYLNFGEDWKTDFTVMIDDDAADNFDPAWVESLAGKTVRARGWLFNKNGPAIAISHPEQVEVIDDTQAALSGDVLGLAMH